MDSVTYSYARQNMAKVMEQVCDGGSPTIITAPRRKVVMISLEDYNAMVETDFLLSSPANAKHLRRSIKQLETGKFSNVRLADV